jgi:hypothetical protein
MKRIVSIRLAALAALMAVATPMLTGCYGSFSLTKKLYSFNGSLGNKWVKSGFVFFLGLVYGLTGTVDACILNLIEFWTGSNPIAAKDGRFEQVAPDGTRVEGRVLADGRLDVTITSPDGKVVHNILERTQDGISMTDANGAMVGRLAMDENGKALLLTPRAN